MIRTLVTLLLSACSLPAFSEILFMQTFDHRGDGAYTQAEAFADFETDGFNITNYENIGANPTIISGSEAYRGKSFRANVGGDVGEGPVRYTIRLRLPGVPSNFNNYPSVYNSTYDDLWMSFWAKGSSNFGQTGGSIKGNSFYFAETTTGYQQGGCYESDETIATFNWGPTVISLYSFLPTLLDPCGAGCSGNCGASGSVSVPAGDGITINESNNTWHHYEWRVKVNPNPTELTGIAEIWQDDVRILNNTSVQWRDSTDWNWIRANFRYHKTGGGDPNPGAVAYYDDYAISTTRLGSTGVADAEAGVTDPPGEPVDFTVTHPN